MDNIRKIFTLGVFDYESVMKTFSQVTNAQVILNVKQQTPQIPNLTTKPIIADRISVRLARAWQKYWECVNKCRLRSNILKQCPGCDSAWPSGTPSPPTALPSPPSFPCCSQCVAEKCIIATGNERCSLGGDIPNAELLLIAQTLCFLDANQEWNNKLDCYECVQNEYVDCGDKCSRPAGPEPSLQQVTDALT